MRQIFKQTLKALRISVFFTLLFALNSINIYAQSYCTPVFSIDYYGCNIKDLTTTGGITNINNTNTSYGLNDAGYSDYTSIQHVTALGQDIGFSMTQGETTDNTYFYVWIDKDNDGTFDATEQVYASTSNATSHSGTILASVLPTNVGIYRMRFMSNFYDVNDPCVVDYFGEAEDYTLIIQATTPCAGLPNAGIVSANPSIASPGDTFSVKASGNVSFGPGFTYQWQKYNEALSDWDEIGTASSDYQALTGEIAPAGVGTQVKYRLKVTCTNSNQTAYSTEAIFTTELVYCIPVFESLNSNDGPITNVTITASGSIINNTSSLGITSAGYSDYTNLNVTATLSSNLDFSVTVAYGSGYYVSIWIDKNRNGTFEASENVYQSTQKLKTHTGTISLSDITQEDSYRIRIIGFYDQSNISPCQTGYYGEAEDYTLTIVIPTPCSGTPNAGNTTTTLASVGETYSVIASGYDFDTGLTFQWEIYNESTSTWDEIGTASSSYQALTGQIAPAFGLEVKYRLKVTCNNSNEFAYSTETIFTPSYCLPSVNSSSDYTTEFSTLTSGSTNIDYTYTSSQPNNYHDFSADPTQKLTITAGKSISFTHSYEGGGNHIRIWIDWDRNGVFEDSEQVFYQWSVAATKTGSFIVPISALGNYRMRVRSQYNSSDPNDPLSLTACGNLNYGSTLDFTMDVQAPTPCSGTPNAGTIMVNPTTANAGSTFDVTAINYDSNTGLTFQWEKYNNTDATWEEVGTSSSSFQVLTGEVAPFGVDTQVKYRLKLTCANSNQTAYSNEAIFKTQKVYCVPGPVNTCSGSPKISNFELNGGITNIANETGTSSTSCGNGGYNNFANISAVAEAGDVLSFIVKIGSYSGAVKIWIDWNNNGEFEASELVAESSSYISSNNTFTGTFTVPAGTPLDNYRMRVRVVENELSFTACSDHNYGETEDYTLIIVSTVACAGVPDTGTIIASPFIVAVGQIYNIIGQNVPYNDGLTFVWEKSTNNGTTWQEVGTPSSYFQEFSAQPTNADVGTEIKYRLKVTCTNSNQTAYSNQVTITVIAQPYCIPNLTYNDSYYIKSFKTNNAVTDINNVTNGKSMPNGYGDFTSTHIIQALSGMTFDFSVNLKSNSNQGLAIWIDWNRNGIFEASEVMFHTTSYVLSDLLNGTITVPTNQETGMYVMRVLNLGYYPDLSIPYVGPCVSSVTSKSGEIEEYTIEVIENTTCSGMPNSSTITANPTTANPGAGFSVTSSVYPVSFGLTFQWEKYNGNTNTWDEIGTSSSEYQPLTGQIAPPNLGDQVKYRLKVTCNNSNLTSYSNEAIFTTGTTTYCTPSYTQLCVFSPKIANFEINDAIINLANNTGTASDSCGTDGYNDFSTISATVEQESEASFVVSVGGYNGAVKLWIDWNDNGLFEPNELIAESSTEVVVGNSFIGNFTVPTGTPIGSYRVRVRVVGATTSFTACSIQNYGEAEDYTISVIAPPSCLPVFSPITATNISITSTLLQWVSDGNLFDIEYGETGFTQGSGTMLTEVSNPYTLQNLTSGTQYQYYVRRNCGNGDESMWRGPISFKAGDYVEKISSRLDTEPEVTSLACGATFNIDVPAGKQISNLKVEYIMTSVNPRWINEQRSVLYSPTLNIGEANVISGNQSNNFPGVESYSRFVNFANGATGTVVFELKAWRVAGNSGCTDDEIFVAPNTWILTPTFEDIPTCPNPPTDLGYNMISESSVELFWTEGEANATHQLKYGNVGFNVNSAGTTENNLTTNSVTLTGLDPFVAQEFYVRRDCGAGDFGTWVGPFRFNSGYCLPYSNIVYHFTSFSTTNAIENVNYSNSTASGTGYVNNTAMIIEQLAGESFDFSSNYIGGASGLRIWVDWNNDFVFDDSEQVFYLGNNSGNKTGNISIASDKLPGDYRMRVRVEQVDNSIPSACGEIAMGEAMDFVLRVACPTIASPTGDENQEFYAGQTIADLVVNGDDLVFYNSTYSETFSLTDLLVDNQTYYVVSQVGSCMSDPLIIIVTLVVSRSDFDLYEFSCHPNPVNDILHFSANLPIEKVTISNILGQQISANLNSDNTILDMSNLPSGNYFVKVTIEGVSKTIKIIKN